MSWSWQCHIRLIHTLPHKVLFIWQKKKLFVLLLDFSYFSLKIILSGFWALLSLLSWTPESSWNRVLFFCCFFYQRFWATGVETKCSILKLTTIWKLEGIEIFYSASNFWGNFFFVPKWAQTKILLDIFNRQAKKEFPLQQLSR